MALTLGRSIDFFAKSDGRDKFAKTFQNWFKVMAWYYQQRGIEDKHFKLLAGRYSATAKKLREFRSLLKFFKWFNNVRDLRSIVTKGSFGPDEIVEAIVNVGDLGYRVGDNIEWLAKLGWINVDPNEAERISKLFQFWAYLFSVVADVMALQKLNRKKFDDEASYEAKKNAILVDLIKDTADFLRVAPNVGFLPLPKHDGLQAALGTIAGAIGAYQVWLKCK